MTHATASFSSSDARQLLVVDDDPDLRHLLDRRLTREGFDVRFAISGEHGLSEIAEHGLPHLALVDVNMPGMDGFDFCESVQEWSDLPIIMLSAVDAEDSVVRAIDYYVEDYVIKPFSPRELVSRVRRVLRRVGNFDYAGTPLLPISERLAVNFSRQELLVNGETVSISPKESKLLFVLLRNAGQVVSTDFLLRRLWPLEDIYEDTLRVHIHRLRRKLEANPRRPVHIRTERGLGYRFVR